MVMVNKDDARRKIHWVIEQCKNLTNFQAFQQDDNRQTE